GCTNLASSRLGSCCQYHDNTHRSSAGGWSIGCQPVHPPAIETTPTTMMDRRLMAKSTPPSPPPARSWGQDRFHQSASDDVSGPSNESTVSHDDPTMRPCSSRAFARAWL